MEISATTFSADQYDLNIRKAIPGYEALHGVAYRLLQTNLSESARLLVVGSDTRMELIKYCQQNSKWLLTGVDPSEEMMVLAVKQLGKLEYKEQVKLHKGYVSTLPVIELACSYVNVSRAFSSR